MAYSDVEIDMWFEGFEEAFEGKLTDDHQLIRHYGGQGWRVKTMGVGLVVLADRNFPYSKPKAFLENYDRSRPRPHIEPIPFLGGTAKICLRTPAVPEQPLLAVQSAVHDARQLLKANEDGEEDEDFEKDFPAYWMHYLPKGARRARLSGLSGTRAEIGAFHYEGGSYFCFPDKAHLQRWAKHVAAAFIKRPRQFPIVELKRLPRPDRFPSDADTLLKLLRRYSADGLKAVADHLRSSPVRLPVLLTGRTSEDRTFEVAVELVVRADAKGQRSVKARQQRKLADEDVVQLYDVFPLNTKSIDAALTRLPDRDMASLTKKVVIVGCGALGSSIAVTLAKSGVSRLILIDPETLDWENVRRHELGAEWIGRSKAIGLKHKIERSIPDIIEVVAYDGLVEDAVANVPDLLADADLVVVATGDWGSDVFVSQAARNRTPLIPAIFTWTEAYALATHAILLSSAAGYLADGFDMTGNFKGQTSHADRKPPPECGNLTSPFGAVEVAQSQSLAAKLALEFLSGRHSDADIWRTWTAEHSALPGAGGRWSGYWLKNRGEPPALGGISEAAWKF
ncbi:HesA/MoeB/ThiF family protein [Rhizobium sp. BR 315]|uniref:HesA/MoeB/ThiF family protein n=1 Tax=Rhizobium sp. BR 315 TaxID=3040014 RepID=UPI003D356D3A